MQKLLTYPAACLLGLVTLTLTACAVERKVDETQRSMLERLPFVHKMTVQQGNIVTADMVNQLQPGMTKRQVRYLLGTPLLIDFFNSDRWDYVYTMQRNHEPEERRRVTVLFKDDALVAVEGDLRPNPGASGADKSKETMVTVPDYKSNDGLISRGLEAVGAKKGK